MSRIVCDHLVPEDQRCLECDKDAAEWHPDTWRILELESRVEELESVSATLRAALEIALDAMRKDERALARGIEAAKEALKL